MAGLPGRRHQGGRAAPCRVPDAPHTGARRGRRHRAAEAPRDGLRQLHPDRRRARRGRRRGWSSGSPPGTAGTRRRWSPAAASTASAATIATFASAAWLYETGFNHFFKGKEGDGSGDQLYIQGHAPGIYARAFLDGRLNEEQLDNFRREAGGNGLPSYPHPRRLPWHRGSSPPSRWASGADLRDLPGAVQPLPDQPRHQGPDQLPVWGVPRRRRDGRAGVHHRAHPRLPARAWTT